MQSGEEMRVFERSVWYTEFVGGAAGRFGAGIISSFVRDCPVVGLCRVLTCDMMAVPAVCRAPSSCVGRCGHDYATVVGSVRVFRYDVEGFARGPGP